MSRLPGGCRHVALDEVDSTNLQARRLYEAGERGPVWISAASQSAGRGRAGRSWQSAPGNLYATLLMEFAVSPAIAAQAGLVAGLGVHDAVMRHAGKGAQVKLKWPNDVLANGRKIAGILCETLGTGAGGALAMAIGCGVNLASYPQHSAYGATSLSELGADLTPERFLFSLAATMDARLAQWNSGSGFDLIRQAWQERAAFMGQPVTIDAQTGLVAGKFAGLAEDGAAVLLLPGGGRQKFYAGDVSLRKSSDAS